MLRELTGGQQIHAHKSISLKILKKHETINSI